MFNPCDIAEIPFVVRIFSVLFKQHDKSSPLNSTHYALYSQNGDRIVATDSVTSVHSMYTIADVTSVHRIRLTVIHFAKKLGKTPLMQYKTRYAADIYPHERRHSRWNWKYVGYILCKVHVWKWPVVKDRHIKMKSRIYVGLLSVFDFDGEYKFIKKKTL